MLKRFPEVAHSRALQACVWHRPARLPSHQQFETICVLSAGAVDGRKPALPIVMEYIIIPIV